MLKRFDEKLADFEAAVATAMLLFMITMAFTQALFRNLTQHDVGWANDALEAIDFADFVLSKGTLWLAFLGASLAVRADKHIAIDVVPRLVAPRPRLFMHALVGVLSAVVCALLAQAFLAAIRVNGEEMTSAYEVLSATGSGHICAASAADLAAAELSKPWLFCAVRGAIGLAGVTINTPGAALQLIVPVMFVVMSLRFCAQGLMRFAAFGRGEGEAPTHHEGGV